MPPAIRLGLLLALLAQSAVAQVRSVEVRTPRPFGYFLGDLVRAQVDIVVEPGFTLQPASLPQPGALAYWLDLRDLGVSQTRAGDAQRVRLSLTYQSFYAALDARALEIPGFTVTFVSESDHGATTAKAEVPAWSFNVSPLREIQPPARDDPRDYMRPDGQVGPGDPRPLLMGAAGSAALALLAFAGLARDRTWWPFRTRRGRPFGVAARRIQGLARRSSPEAGDREANYRDALLALHLALDAGAGRRLLADDLGDFIEAHPAYRADRPGLARFYEASRRTFFGPGPEAGRGVLPLQDLADLARRLARAERAA
ncbi:nonribosomal peptide synthetase MxaA [Methylobacterium sp. J-068]|nr:nonribosomal peptide synthetase MxaA [Methylobacterium sp. J-068]